MKSLLSLLGIGVSAAVIPRENAVEMIQGSPEEVAEAFEAARAEIAKLKGDREYIENRLRDDITALRTDLTETRTKLEAKNSEIVQLNKDLDLAKASASEEARTMLRNSGHKPPADPGSAPDRPNGILAEYRAMKPGRDRLAFAEKHGDELKAAQAALDSQ